MSIKRLVVGLFTSSLMIVISGWIIISGNNLPLPIITANTFLLVAGISFLLGFLYLVIKESKQ